MGGTRALVTIRDGITYINCAKLAAEHLANIASTAAMMQSALPQCTPPNAVDEEVDTRVEHEALSTQPR